MKAKQGRKKRPLVLVIDDKPSQRKTIADILETEAFQPICCKTGKVALEACKRHEVNVAILDLRLPDMDGLELLKQLKEENSEIKVVINTAYASLESAMSAVNDEAFAYVRKMGDVEELLAHVHRAFHAHLKLYSEKLEREVEKRTAELLRANEELEKEITERKRAEETLTERERFLQTIIDNEPECVKLLASDGSLMKMNRAGLDMIEADTFEQVRGQSMSLLVAQEYRKAFGALIEKIFHGKPGRLEFEIVSLKGTRRWLDTHAVPLRNQNDEIIALLGITQDTTERRRAEAALRKSEEKFRTLYEESKDGIFFSTLEGEFLDINPAGVELLGYTSKEELLQVDIARKLYSNPQDRKDLRRALEKQGFVKDYELVLKKKNGEEVIVHETATVVRDESGKIVTLRGILRDMTMRKKLEQQLLHSQKMETVGTLAGGVAHDFNNLLTVILGNAEFGLQAAKPGDPVYGDLSRIEQAALQARDLVSQLLSVSRRQMLDLKLLNLNQTIEEFIKMLKRVIGENIELNTSLAPDIDRVKADPVHVQQVLMNLSVNARDAMPNGGKLILKTRNFVADEKFLVEEPLLERQATSGEAARKYVAITITDTGVGMDQATQARIFEPFFTTKEIGKGSGLGLAVIYGIVKQHRGFIEVESQLGRGATFKIYFPSVAETEAMIEKGKKGQSVAGGKETILVVEDEEVVQNVTERILKKLGYKVLIANSGREAIEIFNKESEDVDLVVLDVVMPEMSGPETYKTLCRIKPAMPVIFVTGYDAHAEIFEFAESGQAEFSILQKPYTKDILASKVREMLG